MRQQFTPYLDEQAPERQYQVDLCDLDERTVAHVLRGKSGRLIDRCRYQYYDLCSSVGSEIEAKMAVALCWVMGDRIEQAGWTLHFIRSQLRLRPFLVDMVIWADPDDYQIALGIECDGANYHSSAKQRRRDAHRARCIKADFGLDIIRFSGSEIHTAPIRCAEHALAALDDVHRSGLKCRLPVLGRHHQIADQERPPWHA